VTGRHRGLKQKLYSAVNTMHILSMCRSIMLWTLYFSSPSVVPCAFSALCMYSTFEHSQPLSYLCAIFCFVRGLHCWTSPWRKLGKQLITHSFTHSPSLFNGMRTEAFGSKKFLHNQIKTQHDRNPCWCTKFQLLYTVKNSLEQKSVSHPPLATMV